jgi:hypothetical protein
MTSSPLGSTGRTYAKQRRMWRRWPVPTRLLVQSTVKRSRMTSSNSGTPSSLNQRSVRSRRTASRPFMLTTARQVRHRVQKFRVRPIVSRVSQLHMCLIITWKFLLSRSPLNVLKFCLKCSKLHVLLNCHLKHLVDSLPVVSVCLNFT